MDYLTLKTIHIVSSAMLFGTGFGTAYFMFMAARSRDAATIRAVSRHVILADWIFTMPTVVIQPVTGIMLMRLLGLPETSTWFHWVIGLYSFVGACWLPVVVLQYRLRRLADRFDSDPTAWAAFDTTMRWWTALGIPAFSGAVGLFALMVFKPGLS
jgi:uncharacterized membrane protein